MRYLLKLAFLLVTGSLAPPALAQLDTLEVTSKRFGRTMSVYTLEYGPKGQDKPVIYFTDGQKMLDNHVLSTLDALASQQLMPPAYFVFVSTIDPQTGTDYRNDYFFCNPDYLKFFEQTLIPLVEGSLSEPFRPGPRVLVGISFGGLNAAYFAAVSQTFERYALLSPITYPCEDLHASIALSSFEGRRIFISTGTYDAERYTEPLSSLFEGKSHQVEFLKTSGGHDFQNWNEQLPKALDFLLREE